MVDKKSSDEQLSTVQKPIKPGEVLRRARKEKGLSAEEVTFHLGLAQRTFDSLENDEYENLPSPLYVKGYIKRYCSIVGIEDKALLSAFEASIRELGLDQKTPSSRFDGGRYDGGLSKKTLSSQPPRESSWGLPWRMIASVCVVALVAVFFWKFFLSGDDFGVFRDDDKTSVVSSTKDVSKKGFQWSPAQPLSDTDEGNQLSDSTDTELKEASITSGKQEVAKSLTNNTQISNVQATQAQVVQVLEINVLEQSWIEVVDANGDMLLADLKPSGYQGEVSGIPPFDVILGNAIGVELRLNGNRVKKPTANSDNTVRLSVALAKEL